MPSEHHPALDIDSLVSQLSLQLCLVQLNKSVKEMGIRRNLNRKQHEHTIAYH